MNNDHAVIFRHVCAKSGELINPSKHIKPCGKKCNSTHEYIELRFWNMVGPQTESDCWPWIGKTGTKGYGRFWRDGWQDQAHRYSYEIHKGEIPPDLVIDHLCRNRNCVNPSHMELVTVKENVLRGIGPSADNYKKTSCLRGHIYTSITKKRERLVRRCSICENLVRRKEYKKSISSEVK